jgi:polyhydroxyalkanoate synthase
MQHGSPDALLAAISQSTNELTQGWMRVLAGAPGAAAVPWLASDAALQASYREKQSRLWNAMLAGEKAAVVSVPAGDRRFSHPAWREDPFYDYLKQSYLLAARYLEDLVEQAELSEAQRERARFAVKQWIDALCPANFPATNPAVLQRARETYGESLVRGVANLAADARRGRIRQTDESAFEVGRNLAATPGTVVLENELMQLIQYAPSTAKVAKRPLVMVPPCINKFYILDLQPENSFVAHAVANGHTVFMVSWRNVGPEQGRFSWDDYLESGVLAALRAARAITQSDKVNALGFCVGGTLLGAALAVLAQRSEPLVSSATFLTAMLDFAEPGPIGVFIDEASVAAREATIGRGGILPGSEFASVFSSLRANDLIWPYVVSNYLLGESPPAFDLLYWNADSTNLPGPMYCYYVRNMYLENRLCMPGALTNCGVPVDLGKVRLPIFVLATREDHIVPWRSAYRTLGLLGGEDKVFVLGGSGHIAGVVNPPAKQRRSYCTAERYPANADDFLSISKEARGSWWPVWWQWLSRHAGGERPAPSVPGSVQYPAMEAAPGRYVKQRIH